MADLKKQLKAIKKLLGDGRDLQLSTPMPCSIRIFCASLKNGDIFTTSRRMALIYIARWKILMALKIG